MVRVHAAVEAGIDAGLLVHPRHDGLPLERRRGYFTERVGRGGERGARNG